MVRWCSAAEASALSLGQRIFRGDGVPELLLAKKIAFQHLHARPIRATLFRIGGSRRHIDMQTSLKSDFFRDRAAFCKQLATSSDIPEIRRRMLTLAEAYLIKAMSAYEEPRRDLPDGSAQIETEAA